MLDLLETEFEIINDKRADLSKYINEDPIDKELAEAHLKALIHYANILNQRINFLKKIKEQ